jgi:NAD(P)-dependent dehydrogenase (short-subunit alcohol dehydrogenase family)
VTSPTPPSPTSHALLDGKSVLVTAAAGTGIGFATAKRCAEEGAVVVLSDQHEGRLGEAAEQLEDVMGARPATAVCDVTDQRQVDSMFEVAIEATGGLDVVVNNAGIPGGFLPVPDTSADDVRTVLETNVLGPVRVLHAFLPLLERSAAPVVVNVSSGMGSFAVTTDPERLESGLVAIAYPASKAAVNMLTSQYAKAYPQMRINAVDPGYTATDLNGHRGTQTVAQGAEIIVRMAMVGPEGPSGAFVDERGTVAW